MKLLNKAGEMPSLEPPDDESIRTLYVGGLDQRINEQDLRDNFYAHGEIETIKMVLSRACAFVTYTTREGAEKAAEELSNKLVIKGLRLKLMWGRPQAAKPEFEVSDEARQAVAHSGLLPRAVISQQQNQVLQPPGFPDQPPAPMHYFNIPPQQPTQPQGRQLYPSMDPQRMGAVIPSQDGASSGSNENRSGSEKQQVQHYPPYSGMPPPQGQFYQPFYPQYGYPQPPYQTNAPQTYQQYPQPPYQPHAPPQAPGGHQAGSHYQPNAPLRPASGHQAGPQQPNAHQAGAQQPNAQPAGPQQPNPPSQTAGDQQAPPSGPAQE